MFLNLVHQYTIQSIKDCSLHYLRIFQVNIQPFRKKKSFGTFNVFTERWVTKYLIRTTPLMLLVMYARPFSLTFYLLTIRYGSKNTGTSV